MHKKTILLVDDDPSVRKLLQAALEKNGYKTENCASGEEALGILHHKKIDAVILDIILPDIDGLEVLKKIRFHYGQLPVLILSCKDSETETVLGLEMGADDYLSKPVRYYELLARLKTAIRKAGFSPPEEAERLFIHSIEMDLAERTVYIKNEPVKFTYLEFELLALMAKHPGKAFTREFLLSTVWHDQQFVGTRTVDVHVRRIRKKLEAHGQNPNLIETIRSVGYRLAPEPK